MNIREDFEKVYANRTLTKVADGWGVKIYENTYSQRMWESWKECQKLNDKRIAELNESILSFVRDDALAISFQTIGQYRSALIKFIMENNTTPPSDKE